MRIALIGGGFMGEALVSALLKEEVAQAAEVAVSDVAGVRREHLASDYGVAVTVPDETEKVVVSIGRTTMRVMPSAKGRFAKPVRVEFAWEGS